MKFYQNNKKILERIKGNQGLYSMSPNSGNSTNFCNVNNNGNANNNNASNTYGVAP